MMKFDCARHGYCFPIARTFVCLLINLPVGLRSVGTREPDRNENGGHRERRGLGPNIQMYECIHREKDAEYQQNDRDCVSFFFLGKHNRVDDDDHLAGW